MSDDFEDLVAAGSRERARLVSAWRAVDASTHRGLAEAASGIETAGATLKWGGLLAVAAAILLRWTKVRSGFRAGKFLWTLAPMLTRIAAPRMGGRFSHLFGRRDSEKR
jgi:hypothetical protein